MINTASRATSGVKIPQRKATRCAIINLFKKNLYELRTRFAVSFFIKFFFFTAHITDTFKSDRVAGKISVTCDAWQASNGDAYFAVTGHWIEETSPGKWTLHSALLGFTQMNCSHSGPMLGRALFKIFHRLNIIHKVGTFIFASIGPYLPLKQIGWITCDNATNNDKMLEFLAKVMNSHKSRAGMKKWSHDDNHIRCVSVLFLFCHSLHSLLRCLAHIINLATQAILKVHSSSKHYDPNEPSAHEPDVDDVYRDEIGLVRSIVVKVTFIFSV